MSVRRLVLKMSKRVCVTIWEGRGLKVKCTASLVVIQYTVNSVVWKCHLLVIIALIIRAINWGHIYINCKPNDLIPNTKFHCFIRWWNNFRINMKPLSAKQRHQYWCCMHWENEGYWPDAFRQPSRVWGPTKSCFIAIKVSIAEVRKVIVFKNIFSIFA